MSSYGGHYNSLSPNASPVVAQGRRPSGSQPSANNPRSPYMAVNVGGNGSQSNFASTSSLNVSSNEAHSRTTAMTRSGLVGGHELGPYSPLNRRPAQQNGQTGSYETDASSSSASPHERLLKEGVAGEFSGVGAVGYGADTYGQGKAEADDYLHDPRGVDDRSHSISLRGCLNVLTLLLLVVGLLTLFAGYPIIYHFATTKMDNKGAFGLGGTNGTGQVALLNSIRPLIDVETPASSKTWTSPISKKQYNLQFSDEFNTEGRTFWKGDDQFWEAVDIWYGVTADYEWYSPDNINTTGGALVLTMTDKPSHNLNFQSGMLQSWNKLCFTGGYIEFSIIQPGTHTTQGYWPGAWIMGNLGRPGYAATTDGMWPYTYQGCDTGILPNQTNAQGGPDPAVNSKADTASKGQLSKLPGMRTPSCTCSGEDHPGPSTKVGRSAPEIDVLEAQIQTKGGETNSYASQSMQVAPYDKAYLWNEDEPAATIHGANTDFNTYTGGVYQESVSSVSMIPQRGFMDYDAPDSEKWVTFGLEWQPDYNFDGSGSVTWYVDGKATWTATSDTVPARPEMEIKRRIVPVEPMSIVMNLGTSKGFQPVDLDPDTGLRFPAQMKFDYVRVYQQKGQESITCDPKDYPTVDYIERHKDVYNNPNLTQWSQTQYAWPKNELKTGC